MKLIEVEVSDIRGESFSTRHYSSPSVQQLSDARISVVGGGFCGTLAVVQIISDYSRRAQDDPHIRKLIINWFEPTRFFGRGVAYRSQFLNEDDSVFLLNQPAERMSPFASDPDHFTHWLERQKLGNRYTFAPRALFGRYLESLLAERVKTAPTTLNLQIIPERVHEVVTSDPEEPIVLTSNGKRIVNDSIILALGHAIRDNFQNVSETPGYLQSIWDINAYRSLVERNSTAKIVTLIGGGPSTIDAIRAFEHVGFKGRYQIISSAIATPWKFDPELYSDQSFVGFKNSNCLGLSAGWIALNQDYLKLHRALRKDVKRARAWGYGEGHVYYSIDLAAIEQIARQQENLQRRDQLIRFGHVLTHLRGSLACPESYELLQELKAKGRLRWIKGRMDSQSSYFDASTGRYQLVVHGRTRDSILVHSDIVANCAQIGSNHKALLGILGDGHANNRIHLLGPTSIENRLIPGQHGVERYRGAVTDVSVKALEQALSTKF